MILLASGLTCFNLRDAHRAEAAASEIAVKISEEGATVVNGEMYIGVLEIPSLGIVLPVAESCNNDTLKLSPCRYSGSVKGRELIIAAHNYRSHFGNIKQLRPGDVLNLTELDGTVHHYEVFSLEKMDGTAIDTMKSGSWDLTLFTCTLGGKSRLAVRAVMR